VYVYLKYLGGGRAVAEVERNLRLTDGVLKYQTVLTGNDVETEAVAIVDDDVRFERLELPPMEEERDESRERQLGLIEPERRPERRDEVAPVEDEGEAEGEAEAASDEEES